MDYHGYGNSRLTSGTATAKKTFIGQYSDSETSLSYLNARYYDSVRGQFLSEDSVFLGMGTDVKTLMLLLADPQSQNSYSYARDNPIGSSDPGGKSWWTGVQGFAAHAAVALAVGVVFGAAATAVIATLPFSATALAVMAVAGGLGVAASTANSVMTTNRAYNSGAITIDQRDAQWGGAIGDIVGGVVGGVGGAKLAGGGAQSVASIKANLGNATGKTVNDSVVIPKDWTATPTRGAGGFEYSHPENPSAVVRLMPGRSNARWSTSRNPYMRIETPSGFLNTNGAVSSDLAETHIPITKIK